MQARTDSATAATPDEFWFLEHPPVFTLGMNSKAEHLLAPGNIPVVQIDRGGQVTYHGPGQLVVYPLLDLSRHGIGVRALVEGIESAIVATVAEWGIEARGKRDAPGVYVGERKLASIGLRIRRGRSLPRAGVKRRDGPRTVCADQPVRLRGAADDAAQRARRTGRRARGGGSTRAAPACGHCSLEPPPRQSATSTWLQDVSSM